MYRGRQPALPHPVGAAVRVERSPGQAVGQVGPLGVLCQFERKIRMQPLAQNVFKIGEYLLFAFLRSRIGQLRAGAKR